MKYQPIITVGRQYGSGGRYVARLLAEKLGIPFYDKELLAEASRDSGICQELLESYDEKQGKNLLFSLISGAQTRGETGSMYLDMPLNHKIFLAQFDTIRQLSGLNGLGHLGIDYLYSGKRSNLGILYAACVCNLNGIINDRNLVLKSGIRHECNICKEQKLLDSLDFKYTDMRKLSAGS